MGRIDRRTTRKDVKEKGGFRDWNERGREGNGNCSGERRPRKLTVEV